MCETMNTKRILRQSIRTIKASYSRAELEALSVSVLQRLEQHPRFAEARTVLLYHSLPDEGDTHAFIDRWCSQKEIILPTVVGDDLELHRYTGPHCLTLGSYGILEPSGELFTDFDRITLAVIPGMAFDQLGNRLGRGKGYYDKFMNKFTGSCIGVSYTHQILPSLPKGKFDKHCDVMITEKGIKTLKIEK